MKLISVNIPEKYLEILEIYVTEKKFPNRSEAIRVGIRDLIKREFLYKKLNKEETQDNSQEKENFNRT
jgi:Arc/MetJ-type ribon-helix-helix transcriptional regulator